MLPRLSVASKFIHSSQFHQSGSPRPGRHQAGQSGLRATSPAARQGARAPPPPVAERSGTPAARKDAASPPLASSAVVSFGARQSRPASQAGKSNKQAMNQDVGVCERAAPADACCEPAPAATERAAGHTVVGLETEQVQQEPAAPADMQSFTAAGVPVYVMLPLDTVNADGVFRYASSRWFLQSLQTLAATGIRGVAIDVWWGAVERKPRRYDWSGYRQLFNLIKALGLKLQVVMSFHACGGNVGDNAQIPLPKWVMQCGERDPDIFFTDRPRELSLGQRNKECISIFADEEPGLLKGRSPIQCYTDFMRAFREEFLEDLGDWIEEVVVGCGPCGELRYPSYVETNGWRFPGIGEFQCYDRRALASLAQAACAVGHPEWGNSGPHDAGHYNSTPEETGFFCSWGGNWDSPYGRFFLSWYSGALLDHGDRMLRAATSVFNVAAHAAASPVSTTTTWPLSKPPSLWDLPAPARQPAYAPPRLLSASMPLLRHQSNSSTEEMSQQAQQAGAAAGQAQQEGGGSGQDVFVPGMFDAPLAAGAAMQGQHPQHSPRGGPGPQQQQQPGAAPMQQQQQWGPGRPREGGLPPSPRDYPAGAMAGPMGAHPASTSASPSPSTPPPVDLASAATWPTAQQQQQAQQALAPQGPGGPVPMSPTPAGGLPSPMSVGMLSQPPSLASLRSSISESVEDLAGVLSGEPQPAGAPVGITIKVAGVHWWFRTRSHAAELTAGYYNTETHPGGYAGIAALCAQYGASFTLTCVEMCDSQHPPEALCGPEGLLRAVREAAAAAGVSVAGENALPCFMPGSIDEVALQRVIYNTQPWGTPLQQGSSPDDRDVLGGLVPPVDMVSSAESSVPWGSAPPPSPHAPPPGALYGGGSNGVSWGGGGSNGVSWGGGAAVAHANGGGMAGNGAGPGSDPPSPGAPSQLPPLRAFTFLRLSSEMMTPDYQAAWARFVRVMQKNAARFKTSRSWRQALGLR